MTTLAHILASFHHISNVTHLVGCIIFLLAWIVYGLMYLGGRKSHVRFGENHTAFYVSLTMFVFYLSVTLGVGQIIGADGQRYAWSRWVAVAVADMLTLGDLFYGIWDSGIDSVVSMVMLVLSSRLLVVLATFEAPLHPLVSWIFTGVGLALQLALAGLVFVVARLARGRHNTERHDIDHMAKQHKEKHIKISHSEAPMRDTFTPLADSFVQVSFVAYFLTLLLSKVCLSLIPSSAESIMYLVTDVFARIALQEFIFLWAGRLPMQGLRIIREYVVKVCAEQMHDQHGQHAQQQQPYPQAHCQAPIHEAYRDEYPHVRTRGIGAAAFVDADAGGARGYERFVSIDADAGGAGTSHADPAAHSAQLYSNL